MDLRINYYKVQNLNLVGYSDINCARLCDDRKSTSGSLFNFVKVQ